MGLPAAPSRLPRPNLRVCLGLTLVLGACQQPQTAGPTPAPSRRPAQAREEVPAGRTPQPASPEGKGKQPPTSPTPEPRWGHAAGHRYLEVLRGSKEREARLPMIIFIHGLGDRPRAEQVSAFSEPARIILPQAPTPHGRGFSWFAYRVGDNDPQGLGQGIMQAADALADLVKTLAAERPTVGKPVVLGFSQGGMLSYALALHHPGLFEAAYPLSGALPEPAWPPKPLPSQRYPPIHAVHGSADNIVPLAPTRAMVDALRARGFEMDLRVYPNVGHFLTPPMWQQVGSLLVQDLRRLEAGK